MQNVCPSNYCTEAQKCMTYIFIKDSEIRFKHQIFIKYTIG